MHAKSAFALAIRGSVCSLAMGLWASSTFADVGRWTSSGPDGSVVLAVAAVPSEPSTLYLATGRRVSTTLCLGGGRFANLPSGAFLFTGFAVSPADSDAGHPLRRHGGQSILRLRTPNGGGSWAPPAPKMPSGLTNVSVILTVTAMQTGAIKTYTNPQATAFQPIQDADAFATGREEKL